MFPKKRTKDHRPSVACWHSFCPYPTHDPIPIPARPRIITGGLQEKHVFGQYDLKHGHDRDRFEKRRRLQHEYGLWHLEWRYRQSQSILVLYLGNTPAVSLAAKLRVRPDVLGPGECHR